MEKICIQTITEELTVNIKLAKFEQIVAENASLKTAIRILHLVPSYQLEDALKDINELFFERSEKELEDAEDQPEPEKESGLKEEADPKETPDA